MCHIHYVSSRRSRFFFLTRSCDFFFFSLECDDDGCRYWVAIGGCMMTRAKRFLLRQGFQIRDSFIVAAKSARKSRMIGVR